jgi:hypothetical protein
MKLRARLFLSAALLLHAPSALSWGPLGHRIVAETAARLVELDQPGGWGPILARHRFELGWYAVVPDAVFRHERPEVEGPTHFFEIDLVLGPGPWGGEAEEALGAIPGDFLPARDRLEAKIGRERLAIVGRAPWRVEQLRSLAAGSLAPVRSARGGYQRGNTSGGDARAIFDGIYYLGVLSHYTGDAAMPYHAVSDWNGWGTGQGNVHFYFESDCVNALEPGLGEEVLLSARRHREKWLADWRADEGSTPATMYRVFLESARSVATLARLDRERVVVTPSDAGAKVPAVRRPAASGCRALRGLLVERLARGAALTAWVWEGALPAIVDFEGSATLQFSDLHEPEFIAPDYGDGGAHSARETR